MIEWGHGGLEYSTSAEDSNNRTEQDSNDRTGIKNNRTSADKREGADEKRGAGDRRDKR